MGTWTKFQIICVGLLSWWLLLQSTALQAQITAEFTANNLSGCSPLTVQFAELTTGSVNSYNWDFGNGNTSTLPNPGVIYVNPGTYTVSLTVSDGANTTTETKTAYITVFADPVADFSVTPVTGCAPLTVSTTDLSVPGDGAINNWTWDFGDGTVSTNTAPDHTYLNSGMYDVSLTVTDVNGCSGSKLVPDLVTVGAPPQVNVSMTPPTVCQLPYVASFSSSVTGSGNYSYEWDFGDGGSSTQANPSHGYASPGTYTVTLITTDAAGCADTTTLPDPVQVAFPSANFAVADTVVCVGENLQLSNLSTGAVDFQWNFGDGTVFNGPQPSFSYNAAGSYSIRLIATNAQGCADTLLRTAYVTVSETPVAQFASTDRQSCELPFLVEFSEATQGATSWQWNFGDGNFDTGPNPTHLYQSAGFFPVTLIATGLNGCSDTLIRNNYVQIQPPQAEFIADTIAGCIPLTVDFQDLSTSAFDTIDTWLWNFGDGGSSFAQNPSHVFNSVGQFTVQLIVVTTGGCRDTATLAIQAGTPPVVDFDANPKVVCATDPVSFLDNSSLATEWYWEFGDGGTSNAQNPIYTYGDTGLFDVTLVALYFGCPDTLVKPDFIRVLPPIAEFFTNPLYGCEVPLTVSFNDVSIGADHWFWDFGDGSSDTVQFPTHTFTALGTYTITLTVTNDSTGCSDDYSYDLVITQPTANFAATDTFGCIGNVVNFLDLSGGAMNYLWDFGDGDTSNVANPSHSYSTAGTYDVTLIVSNDVGCRDTMVMPNLVEIIGPQADFNVDTSTGCAPLSVVFSNQSTATTPGSSITGYFWDFGDGVTSTAANPSHQFVDPGEYDITLVVVDDQGCADTLVRTGFIQPTYPTAAFTTLDTLTCPGAPVAFVNQSTGVGNTYQWNFGDGTSSTVANPVKVYPGNSGQFTVSLIATDVNGCQSITTLSDFIEIGPPEALFAAAPTQQACPPLNVSFTNQSSPNVTNWYWDFGDGSTSTLPNPSKVYNLPGQYDVQLIVATVQGCRDTLDLPGLIDLTGPQGNFSFTPLEGCSPFEVTFTAQTQGAISWTWDFGDGSLGTGQSVTHIYLQDTVARPTLVIEDTAGCTVAIPADDSIVVRAGPNPQFQVLQTQTCLGEPLLIQNQSTSPLPITAYLWDFGDGNTSTAANPQHAYVTPGTYSISLTTTNLSGCVDSFALSTPITVAPRPTASFIPSQLSGCAPLSVTFNGQSGGGSPIALREWDFGDGTTLNGQQSPLHTFATPGTYTVRLAVQDANGCRDSMELDIVVLGAPAPNFTVSATDGCAPRTVQFSNLSQGNIASWFWDFGDGGTSTQANPSHTYQTNGDFDVSLTVTNAAGCSAPLTKPDLIRLKRPAAAFTSNATLLCPPAAVDFTAQATGDTTITQWLWDFGNGDTAIGPNPTYTYSQGGNFDVTLIVVDALGCTDTLVDSQHVAVSMPPQAGFTLDDSVICAPGTITALDASQGVTAPIVGRVFDFGNGQTAGGTSATGLYQNAGNFTLNLVVTDANGCTDTATQAILVHPPVNADFAVSDSTGCSEAPFSFFDQSSGSTVVNWSWDFGDGNTSNQAFPIHAYDSAGSYTVTLAVQDQNGCVDTISKPNLIDLQGPSAAFTPLQSSGCIGSSFTFTDASTGASAIVGWSWSFGDGDSSNQQNPVHLYDQPGVYDVSLTVTDANGCRQTETVPQAVVIFEGPQVTFAPDITQGCAPLTVQFTDQSTSPNSTLTGWQYQYGNGSSYNFPNGTQTYTSPGTFEVVLTVTDAQGCAAADTQQITVLPGPNVDFISNIQSGCPPRPIDFLSQSGGPTPLASWSWDFGDGNTGNGPLFTHTYQANGLYDVKLVVEDANGCRDSLIRPQFIRIGEPLIDFGVNDSLPCPGEVVTFTDFSQPDTPFVSWSWDFGDGHTATGQTASHAYADSGRYDVTLTVVDALGCIGTRTIPKLVKVQSPPVAYFTAPAFGCEPAIIQALDSSYGVSPINTWNWQVNGSPEGSGQQAQFFFNQIGRYDISLRVIDDRGCSNTFTQAVEVMGPPEVNFTASDTVGCSPIAIVFNGQSTPAGLEWIWDFGDGNTDSLQSPIHGYEQDGQYDVSLTVIDQYGCTATRTKPQYIDLSRPEADFTARYVPACPPVEATFTAAATSPYGITQYQWNFGDGAVASGNPAIHTYLDTGNYVVTLTVVDGLGCEQVVEKDTAISIFGENKPAPVLLHAVSVEDRESVRMSWAPSRASDFSAYLVYWQNASTDNWEEIYRTTGRQDTSYLDRRPSVLDCEANSYCYLVVQQNECGTLGSLTEVQPHCTIEAEAQPLPDRILVSWNNYQGWNQVDHYEIYRVSDYQPANAEFLALVPGSDNSYVDEATTCFNQYSYRIRAFGTGLLQTSWSDTTQAQNAKSAPAESAELVTATVVDNRDIHVKWLPWSAPDLIEVLLERSEDNGGTWLTVGAFPPSQLSYRDSSVRVNEQSYTYRLQARDSCGFQTPYSNLGKSILLEANSENFANELTWTAYEEWANGVEAYRIEVLQEATGQWVEVDVVSGDRLSYVDRSTFFEQGQYCYRIIAQERGGNQALSMSNEACTGISPKLYVPNVFTPNNDGINETFRLNGVYLREVEVRIYSRWGKELFVGHNLDDAWDGRYAGQLVPEGVYTYIVEATAQNGASLRETGTVTVLR